MKLTIPITPELRVRLLHAQNIEIEVPDTAVPEGWQLVPVEPTPEMLEAYFAGKIEAQSCTHQQRARERVARDYRAMLAAAPKPEGGAA